MPFRGYENFVQPEDHSKDMPKSKIDFVDQDKMMMEIFAPDPITGKPRSDLHFIYSKDSNPIVQEYIKNTLCQAHESETSFDNPDDALELMKSRLETNQQYVQRLEEIFSKGE